MNSTIIKTLWMGDIDSFIDEEYIYNIFRNLNIKIKYVRIIRDKQTGHKQGYCFLDFETKEEAAYFLDNFNGKPIPNCNRFFKLNWAMHNSSRIGGSSTSVSENNTSPINSSQVNQANSKYIKKQKHILEFTIYVGELDSKVNEETLINFFKEYKSINSVKIIIDPKTKISKGFGFIKFTNYFEFHKAIKEMNGRILLSKSIKVNQAGQKKNFGEFINENSNGNFDFNKNKNMNVNLNHSNYNNIHNNNTNFFYTNNFTQNNYICNNNSVCDSIYPNNKVNSSTNNEYNRNIQSIRKYSTGYPNYSNFSNSNCSTNLPSCESLKNNNSFNSLNSKEDSKNYNTNCTIDNFSIENIADNMDDNNKITNDENSLNLLRNYMSSPYLHCKYKKSFSNFYENRKCPLNNFLYYYNIIDVDKEINFLDQFYISFSKYGHSYECINVDKSKSNGRQDYLLSTREDYCNNSENFYNSENSAMGIN